MSWRPRASLSPAEAHSLHRDAIVIDSKFPGSLAVPSPRVREVFEKELAQGNYRHAIAAKIKALAAEELWTREDARAAYLEAWDRSGLTAGLVSAAAVQPDGETAFPDAVRAMGLEIYVPVLTSRGAIRVATSARDIEEAHEQRHHAIIIGWENSTPIGADLGRLDLFYNCGVRSVQLTYNVRNLVGDGSTEPAGSGLSRFGHALVDRLNAKRMIVDVSHASEAVVLDTAKATSAPISANHTSAKAVYMHDRGSSDAALRAVAETGGYVGVLLMNAFLHGREGGTLDHWAAHVEHIVRLIGVGHVGIGCDTGDIYQVPPKSARWDRHYPATYPWHGFGPEHVTHLTELEGYKTMFDWPNLTAKLAERGFNEEEIRALIGGNYLRFFREVVG